MMNKIHPFPFIALFLVFLCDVAAGQVPYEIRSPSGGGVLIDGGTVGITVEGTMATDSPIETDSISEATPGNGVAVDGVLLKDGYIDLNLSSIIKKGTSWLTAYQGGTDTNAYSAVFLSSPLAQDAGYVLFGQGNGNAGFALGTTSAEGVLEINRVSDITAGTHEQLVVLSSSDAQFNKTITARDTFRIYGDATPTFQLYDDTTLAMEWTAASNSPRMLAGDTFFMDIAGNWEYQFTADDFSPYFDSGNTLGTASKRWSFLYSDNVNSTGIVAGANGISSSGSITTSGNIGVTGSIYDISDSEVNFSETISIAGNIYLSGIIYDSTDSQVNIGEGLYVAGSISAADGMTVTSTGAGYSGIHNVNGTAYTIGQNSNSRYLHLGSGSGYLSTGVRLSAGGTVWGTYSDERLKRGIKPLSYGLEDVKKLNPIWFNYKTDNLDVEPRIGFSAQNAKTAIPEMVTEDFTEDKYMSVTQGTVIPVLVNAVKQLDEKNTALKSAVVCLASAETPADKTACASGL